MTPKERHSPPNGSPACIAMRNAHAHVWTPPLTGALHSVVTQTRALVTAWHVKRVRFPTPPFHFKILFFRTRRWTAAAHFDPDSKNHLQPQGCATHWLAHCTLEDTDASLTVQVSPLSCAGSGAGLPSSVCYLMLWRLQSLRCSARPSVVAEQTTQVTECRPFVCDGGARKSNEVKALEPAWAKTV